MTEQIHRHPDTDKSRWAALGGVVWVLALYVMCHPSRGIRHDAQIYFGQTQLHLTPEWMSRDLFFLFGSQDRYSVFSTLFAPVLSTFGLVQAEIGTMLALHVLFWIALWSLTRRMPTQMRWAALAVVAALPHFYGGFMAFSFNEPFLTARSLAEPFCIFALAAFDRDRLGWTAGWLALALISHPLLAIPVGALVWYLLCERDRRWLWAGLVLVAAALAGWLGVKPLDGLFRRYDDVWFNHVYGSNGFDFLRQWDRSSWALNLFDIAWLALISFDAEMPLRRLYRATAVVGVALVLLSGVLVDGLHLVLPTQLQLWRVMWIVHLLALLSLYPGLLMLWRRGPVGRLAAAAVALATVIVNGQAGTSYVFAAAAILVAIFAMRRAVLDRRIVVGGIAVCVLGAVVMGLIEAIELMLVMLQHYRTGLAADRLASIPAAIPQLMLAVAWLALIGAAASRRRWALPASACVGIVMLGWGMLQWDQRDDWARYVESHYNAPSPFNVELPKTAVVYWPDEMLAPWVLLQRPNYLSLANEAGAVFNREATTELDRRRNVVLPMRIQTEACVKIALEGHADYDMNDCKYTDDAIRDVCRAPGAPDNVVLMNPLQMPAQAIWNYQPPGRRPEPFYLYDCHRF
jgi:hypothetical protein